MTQFKDPGRDQPKDSRAAPRLPRLPSRTEAPSRPPTGADLDQDLARAIEARRRAQTSDMQGLLGKIAGQIADADRRNGDALKDVQARLSDLAERATAAKQSLPGAGAAGLGQIEGRIADIARSVEQVDRSRQESRTAETAQAHAAPPQALAPAVTPAEVAADEPMPDDEPHTEVPALKSASHLAERPPMHVRGFGRSTQRSVHSRAEAERIAQLGEGAQRPVPGFTSAMAAAKTNRPVLEPPMAPPAADLAEPWDQEAAEALARIYASEVEPDAAEPVESAAPVAAPAIEQAQTPAVQSPPAQASAPAAPAPQPAAASAPAPRRPEPPALASAAQGVRFTSPLAEPRQERPQRAPAQAMASTDREWLEGRFAEIATQLERSLGGIGPDRAISALGGRFDALEARLDAAIGQARAGGGQGTGDQAVRAIEKQLQALKSQIDAMLARMEVLETLKAEFGHLSAGLVGLEQVHKMSLGLTEDVRGTTMGLTRLEKGHSVLVEQISAARGDMTQLARLVMDRESDTNPAGDGSAAQQLGDMQNLFSSYIDERRESEGAMVGVLQAMQDAIDRLAQRFEGMEGGTAMPAPEPVAPVARRRAAEPAPEPRMPRPVESAVRYEALAPEHVAVEPEPAPEPAPRLRRNGAPRARVEEPAPPPAEPELVAAQQVPQPEADTPAEPRSREDILNSARRAANNSHGQAAVTAQAQPAAAPERATRAKAKAPRAGFFSAERGAARPVHIVSFVALLAAGAGMLWGMLADKPQATPTRIEKSKPAGKVGDAGAERELKLARDGADSRSGESRPRPAVSAEQASQGSSDAVTPAAAPPLPNDAALAGLKSTPDHEHAPKLSTSTTAGIMLDAGAPMPTPAQLSRMAQEQRMAQMSSEVGAKAVQKTARDYASPAAHAPDTAIAPEKQLETAPPVSAAVSPTTGLPPAAIGPMSLRVAAAKGDPSAEFEVAARFAQGKGVPKDFGKAAEWYQRAAARGFAPAQYRLGGLYERGLGVTADAARARIWYRRAAELGNVKAMHNLAVMHTQRTGGEPDYASAVLWFTQAAVRGLSDSQFNLAILHENGLGVAKSPVEAYKWFSLAAERGDGEAARRRDTIEARLSGQEVMAGKQALGQFRQQPVDAHANDPFVAGQAWRNRNLDEPTGNPGASSSLPAPARNAREPRADVEAEIIDLTEPTIRGKATQANAQPQHDPGAEAAAAIATKKRKVIKAQTPADVEKVLTKLGYDPSVLKKARPGGDPEQGQPAQPSN
jgi:localization factor PodJL